MTTLIDEGDALVVRCDSCRRLWPVTRERLESCAWTHDEAHDVHRCSVCLRPWDSEPHPPAADEHDYAVHGDRLVFPPL
jgi:hypothetical protein